VKGYTFKIIRICLLLGACAWMVSCSEKKPEDVLTKPQMVKVMGELYVAEEKINQLGLTRDSAKIVFEALKQKVFENTSASDSVFKKSLDYYMERPKEMELIYTALVDSLQLREQREPARPDYP